MVLNRRVITGFYHDSKMQVIIAFNLRFLLASFLDTEAGQIGVCYGKIGNNLPHPVDVVAFYRQRNIHLMWLYDPDQEVLTALNGSNLELLLDVPNSDIQRIASNQSEADTRVRNNVRNYTKGVRFRYISVGNEMQPSDLDAMFLLQAMQNIERAVSDLGVKAMQNIDKALSEAGLSIPVSTTTYMGAFVDTYPPSCGRFSDDYLNFLKPVIGFLVSKRYPLLVNIYTYFGYKNGDVSLEFSLFKPSSNEFNDPNNQLHHQNLFDSNLDSVYVALEKSGGGSLEVVVSESGWPTQGGPGASVGNAEAYINNLIQHIRHVR
uniref:glucan endo-1,3-beta-D-glucosidase n=1 Tax=Brassica campestris TaxID=3711 RepID=A0A3P6C8Q2_BRACM|nr:unnamed protein product [Brassica rapa]